MAIMVYKMMDGSSIEHDVADSNLAEKMGVLDLTKPIILTNKEGYFQVLINPRNLVLVGRKSLI